VVNQAAEEPTREQKNSISYRAREIKKEKEPSILRDAARPAPKHCTVHTFPLYKFTYVCVYVVCCDGKHKDDGEIYVDKVEFIIPALET